MIPTSTPIRSTKRPSGQTLQTSDDIWAAAKVSRVELRPLLSRPAASVPAPAHKREREGTREPIAVVGGDGCSRRHFLLPGDPIDLSQVLRRQRPPHGAHILLHL